MNKQKLKEQFLKIQAMGIMELNDYIKKINGSLLDSKYKEHLNKAVEIRFSELDISSAMVENGDMSIAEVKGDNQ